MDLMQYMLIFATIMIFVAIYLGVRDQYKSQEEIAKRNYELERYYDSIDVGDVFECKADINKIGFSKSNPFEQIRCEIVNKKDGWVVLKFYNNNATHQMPFEQFIKKGYKYIYNVNNRTL